MTKNYEYKVGGSLGKNAPSYVVRQADNELYRYLKSGEFCYIFNSRQMGKTSLIVRTMNKLKAEGYACTSLDFSVRGSGNIQPEQWYAGIVYKLVTNFELGNPKDFLLNWWNGRNTITGVERLDEFIETVLLTSVKSNIVIFIDEIDSILSLNFPTDDFFALIRSCYEKRNFNSEYKRLTFAFVGVATPGDLISDKRRTPFNIGKAIQLDGFKESEIEPLAKGFYGIVENPNGLIKEVLSWTGGQPFLTQKVCKLLKDEKIGRDFKLEPIFNNFTLNNWEAHDEPEHLKTIRDRML
ncbi:MAG: AAA-like domain-containing protein, partial [Cyanobacteria bacterium J06641_2]